MFWCLTQEVKCYNLIKTLTLGSVKWNKTYSTNWKLKIHVCPCQTYQVSSIHLYDKYTWSIVFYANSSIPTNLPKLLAAYIKLWCYFSFPLNICRQFSFFCLILFHPGGHYIRLASNSLKVINNSAGQRTRKILD